MEIVTEGSARIQTASGVFYNPKMRNLRDISVLFLKAANAKGRLLDSTAATGVRGIRYAKEAGFQDITLLDINTSSSRNATKNLKMNKLQLRCMNRSIQSFCADGKRQAFDVIDLDPFGTPVPYINDLLKISKDGTIFMVTATDTAVLCGAHQNACLKMYGSVPMHNELCKESGIRILINFIVKSAAQFNFGTEAMLSISDMHYMRVFVRLNAGARKAVDSVKQCGFASFCPKCHSFYYAPGLTPMHCGKCRFCGAETKLFGPMYLGRIQDKTVISRMLHSTDANADYYQTADANALLQTIFEESEELFFYSIPKITKSMHISSASPEKVMELLISWGFRTSRTQFDRDGIKTAAGIETVRKAITSVKNME